MSKYIALPDSSHLTVFCEFLRKEGISYCPESDDTVRIIGDISDNTIFNIGRKYQCLLLSVQVLNNIEKINL